MVEFFSTSKAIHPIIANSQFFAMMKSDCSYQLLATFVLVLLSPILVESVKPSQSIENHETIHYGPRFRLPNSLIPYKYNLRIRPILYETSGLTRFTAPGSVKIGVTCAEATSTIRLHAIALNISQSSISVFNLNTTSNMAINGFGQDLPSDFFIINLQQPCTVGQHYEIYMEFIAPVSQTRLDGMYLDYYEDPVSGETRMIATTTFAANAARRAFPCFDEPALKSIFEVTLGRQQTYHSLSNTEQIRSEPMANASGWFWDHFAPTPPMSTYLLAMIVSDLHYEEVTSSRPIRVYAMKHLIDRGGGVYAANLTNNVLREFEIHYNMNYSLQKLDSVALPHFLFSAMENWGLITYNENALLFLANETTESQRYRITNIVSHEVAHMWFGNIVTCQWWTWIWLNEGFATWTSHWGVEQTYPEFEPWKQFIFNVYQNAMNVDVGPTTHPVEYEPPTSAAIGGIYDRIVYDKGACLLRMMEGFLTAPIMNAGIRDYLVKRRFSPAVQDDLFDSLQSSANSGSIDLPTSVKNIMDTWTKQAGYPVLRVSEISGSEISISQEPIVGDGPISPNASWWVPIELSTEENPDFDAFPEHWIPGQTASIQIPVNTNQWIVVNPSSFGYYRVLYSSNLMKLIIKQLDKEHTSIDAVARSKLIDDAFNLAFQYERGDLLETALKLIQYIGEETDYVVWKTILKNLQRIQEIRTPAFTTFTTKDFLLPRIVSALQKMEIGQNERNKGSSVMLQNLLFTWACAMETSICSGHIRTMLDSQSIFSVPVDLQEAVFCAAVSGEQSASEFLMKTLEREHIPNTRLRILNGLSCSSNEEVIKSVTKMLEREQLMETTVYKADHFVHDFATKDIFKEFSKTNW